MKVINKIVNFNRMEIKNGVIETHYDNGQLKSRATYKNGKLNGLYEDWHANGKPWTKVNYKNGKLDGLCEWWQSDGQLWKRETYKDRVAVE